MRRARVSAPGLLLLALLGFVAGGHAWLAASSFVPVLRDGRIEYVLLSRSSAALAAATTGSTLGLLLLHVLLSARVFHEPTSFRARDLRYLAPIGILAFSFVALVNLLPATYGHLFVWSYLAIDLRPWLTLAAAGLLVASIDALLAVADEVDRRDRLVELRDLALAADALDPAIRGRVLAYVERVLAIEGRAASVAVVEPIAAPGDPGGNPLIVEEVIAEVPIPEAPAPAPAPSPAPSPAPTP